MTKEVMTESPRSFCEDEWLKRNEAGSDLEGGNEFLKKRDDGLPMFMGKTFSIRMAAPESGILQSDYFGKKHVHHAGFLVMSSRPILIRG